MIFINKNKVKEYAKEQNVYLWQVADKLKMRDSELSRMLRYELSEEKLNQIINAIDELGKAVKK